MNDVERYNGYEYQPESVWLDDSDLGWLSTFIFSGSRSPYRDTAIAVSVLKTLLSARQVEVRYGQTTLQPLVDKDGSYYFEFTPIMQVKYFDLDWLFAFRPYDGFSTRMSQERREFCAKFLEAIKQRVPSKVVYVK